MIEEAKIDEELPYASAAPKGHECIRSYLNALDGSPGVYRMLGEKGDVLYVGKARNLRKRVSSYAKPHGHSPRIRRMVASTSSMMFLTTTTETEALLLEQNLIKQLKPRFNVLLRDDKSFPNILISYEHAFPQLRKHRGSCKEKGSYFGPFASAQAVNRTLNQLQKVFLLRSCSDSVFESRTRPCLLYQIKRCCAPCVGFVSTDDYGGLVKEAERFLSGKSSGVQEQLAIEMHKASADLEFERAAALRDRIKALTSVQSVQGVNPRTVYEADLFALYSAGGQACVQVFFFRAGQNWGNHAYYPNTGSGAEDDEVLEAFVVQFYTRKPVPKTVILSRQPANADLIQDMLSRKAERQVRIIVPIRGEKAILVKNALRNARESLAMRISESAAQARLIDGLVKILNLDGPVNRIEVFDNSHIQGSNAVGAMIVANREGFLKSSYRKFNFKKNEFRPGDDLAMMQEVFERRFARLFKEDRDRMAGSWPDLLLIDGGRSQVSAAYEALAALGVAEIPILGISKGPDRDAGREELHIPNRAPFALAKNDPVLYFLQRLRDEAHRFAIGAHRSKRKKAVGSNLLDSIPGIGAVKKRALLAHFGSAKAVGRAGFEDLKAVDGISISLAERIFGHFRDRE
ncbi:MAG: excinuclease ABC subunit UvrC [Albidovulum sp.]|nr:excinuclease ABC subunit UvrC [Albidovulum sp.]MDE0531646.1 excinuclease ABC subunit UvrC [Albidovulum sp.]